MPNWILMYTEIQIVAAKLKTKSKHNEASKRTVK